MNAPFEASHFVDAAGNPAGGCTTGTGVVVSWQNGPLGRGDERKRPNGAFVETVIAIAVDRLNHYQQSKFACDDNEQAIGHLMAALKALNARTERREAAGVEGTHAT